MSDHEDFLNNQYADVLHKMAESLERIEHKVDRLIRGREESRTLGAPITVCVSDILADNDDMATRTPKEQCEHEPNPNTLTCNKCGVFLR